MLRFNLYGAGLELMLENKNNVHKNLGECYMEEENWAEAEDHFFLATQIDRTDVTLWWQLGKRQ